jgi:hypothetical protein
MIVTPNEIADHPRYAQLDALPDQRPGRRKGARSVQRQDYSLDGTWRRATPPERAMAWPAAVFT